MIARIWRGWVASSARDAYVEYLEQTGMPGYRNVAGNRGAWTLTRDLGDGRTEVLTLSFWDSYEAVRVFAGEDVGRAVFYAEDDRFLVDRERTVTHYEVDGSEA